MAEQTEKVKEISLAELYQQARVWFLFLLTKWKLLVPVGFVCGVLGFTYASFQKKVYKAELSFALEEKQSSMGAYAAIASQFGIDLGGGNGGAFAGDNLVELLKTRLMVEKALLKTVVIEGDTQLLINRYIKFKELKERWSEDPELKDLSYEIGVPRDHYTIKQDSVLDKIQEHIRKTMLTVKRVDKKLNLVIVKCSSEDELFAKYFVNELVSTTSFYYIEGKTKKARINIANLEFKIDSIKKELDRNLYGAAVDQDRDLNVVRAERKVPMAKKQIDIQLLSVVYAELTKNLEISKYTLTREEPLIHIIDTPILPLRYEKPSRLITFITFGFLSGLVLGLYLIIKEKNRKKSNE
jgi:hypothetical protein